VEQGEALLEGVEAARVPGLEQAVEAQAGTAPLGATRAAADLARRRAGGWRARPDCCRRPGRARARTGRARAGGAAGGGRGRGRGGPCGRRRHGAGRAWARSSSSVQRRALRPCRGGLTANLNSYATRGGAPRHSGTGLRPRSQASPTPSTMSRRTHYPRPPTTTHDHPRPLAWHATCLCYRTYKHGVSGVRAWPAWSGRGVS